MTDLLLLVNLKSDSNDIILIIVDCLTKIMYYELVKTMINTASLAEVIINMVIRHFGIPMLIINDQRSLFTS